VFKHHHRLYSVVLGVSSKTQRTDKHSSQNETSESRNRKVRKGLAKGAKKNQAKPVSQIPLRT